MESLAQAITICPPGTTNTLLLTDWLGVGDAGVVDDGELDGDVDGDDEPDDELTAVGETLGGRVVGGAVLAGATVGAADCV